MSDIKLFRIQGNGVTEIEGRSVAVEKSLQTLIEKHLEDFFGVRFLASEYSTGKTHGGRIDTLGIDENGCPVILEYKRATNENVINQGLFYLDWLLDHKGEFTLLTQKTLGKDTANAIEWSAPRLLCIAGDFTRYDEHAVQQINRNIELIRYRRYGTDHILFELVNAIGASGNGPTLPPEPGPKPYKTFAEYLKQSSSGLRDLFESLKANLVALGDDVQVKELKYYMAFRRFQNFACVEVHPQAGFLLVYVKISLNEIKLKEDFTRDVRNIGHFGTGNVEIKLRSQADLEHAKPLLQQSYDAS